MSNRIRFLDKNFSAAEDSMLRQRIVALSQIPSRRRGESFGQKERITYSFAETSIIGCLLAVKCDRAIVVQIDVAKGDRRAEWPVLSEKRGAFAEKFLKDVRSRCQSPWARWKWLITGVNTGVETEGPFMPAESLVALQTLIIRVSRDANYDAVYRKVHKFIELHPENDDRKKFLPRWSRKARKALAPKPAVPAEYYSWSCQELTAVGQMAHLESGQLAPDHDITNDLATDEQRREHNRRMLYRAQSKAMQNPEGAAGEAVIQIRRIFSFENNE